MNQDLPAERLELHPEPFRERSTLVTLIAGFGIVSGALGTLGLSAAMLMSMRFGLLGPLAGCVMGLVASVGLLRRRNWARLSFIGVQGLAIANTWFRVLRFWGLSPMPTIAIVGALAATAFGGLIIGWLCSRRVREEFDAERE